MYKNENTLLANYSFIFLTLEKDGFIICTQKKYVDFLNENYQITIDKVDSRQNGKNKKTNIYETLKKSIFD